MLATTFSEELFAKVNKDACPAWSAPIVGTKAQAEGSSCTFVTTFMAPVLSGTGQAVL
jgi:hypothetical protein